MIDLCLAYIDPGAGSILLQVFIGSLIGAGFFFRRAIAGVFRVFRRGDKRSASQEAPGRG